MPTAQDHHGTYRGRICRIVLKDGTEFYDRFIESKSQRLRWEKEGWISRSKIHGFYPFDSRPGMNGGLQVLGRIQKPKVITIKQNQWSSPSIPSVIANPPSPVSAPESEAKLEVAPVRPSERTRETIPAFANALPDGRYLLSLILPSMEDVIKVKRALGIEGSVVAKKRGSVKTTTTKDTLCDYCGDIFQSKREYKDTSKKRKCKKPECFAKYQKEWRGNKLLTKEFKLS